MKKLKSRVAVILLITMMCFSILLSANIFKILPAQALGVYNTIPVGTGPYGVAYDSGKGEIFVANSASGTVSVISDSTNAVVATVTVGTNPQAVAYDSGKGEIFVANYGSASVSVISDSTNAVVATVTVGGAPDAVAYDPINSTLYVPNWSSGSVSVISDYTNGVITTVPVGVNPSAVAYDSGRGLMYVTNQVSGTVSVITHGATVIATVTGLTAPDGVAYDSNMHEIFVANWGANSVSVIRDSDNIVVAAVPVGAFPSAVAYDSGKGEIFVTNWNAGTVSVISDSTNFVVATVTVGGVPAGAAYDSSRSEVFVSNSGSNTVSVISDSLPSIGLSPSSGTVGSSVAVTGSGFASNNLITIMYGDYVMTTVLSDGNGGFSGVHFPVPASSAGSITFFAYDSSGNGASALFTVLTAIVLSPSGGVPGDSVTVAGSGFFGDSTITMTYDGSSLTLLPSVPISSGSGDFVASFAVPDSLDGPHTVIATDSSGYSASATFTVGTGSITVSNIVDVSPSSDWTYLLMQGETVVDEFSLVSGGSKTYPTLIPGSYRLEQTEKLRYTVEGVTVDSVSVAATKLNNFTYVDINLLTGSTMSVVFSNKWIPDAAFAKPGGSGGSLPSAYTMPSRIAVPIQVSWNPDIEPNQELDIIKDRPIKIMVNLADLLTTSNPLGKAIALTDSVTVTVTCSPAGFFVNPVSYTATRTGAAITANSFIVFDMNPPTTAGHYTITCTVKKGTTTVSTLLTTLKVRATSPLYLYYSHLTRAEYGTMAAGTAGDAFDTMVTNTAGFIKSVYPVPGVTVGQNTAGIAGAAYAANYLGMLADCQTIELAAKTAFFDSPNVIGVAIGPDLSAGGVFQNYFVYHGAVSGGKVAVGVSFGPAVKGVVVSDGYYSAAAHEIGHTFGLYYGVPEQYTQYNPGAPANGYLVDQNQWRSGCYDFMGLSTLRSTTSTWTSTSLSFDPIFASLKTTADPQIILVNGIITKDGTVETANLPDQWYKFPYGIPDTVPTGNYAIRFTLKDGTTVERSFAAQFFLNLDPGIAVGEDLPGDFTGFGTIATNFAGFAFATEYPANTDPTHSIEVVDKTRPAGQQVIGTLPATSVVTKLQGGLSAGFGGFLSPIKGDLTSFSAGTTIPVKFQLKNSQGKFITDAQPTLFLSYQGTGKETAAVATGTSNIGNLFRYDAGANQYIFNLDTRVLNPKTGTWQLKVYLGDGTVKTVNIKLS